MPAKFTTTNPVAMATKFKKKIGYNSACITYISEILASVTGGFGIKLSNDVRQILKRRTQVAMATKFET